MKKLILFIYAVSVFSCDIAGYDPVTQEELYKHVSYLASDDLMGRDTGSPGITLAEDYIAEEFSKYGLVPMQGQTGFFIDFEVIKHSIDPEKTELEITSGFNSYNAEPCVSFKVFDFSGTGSISTEAVFAGYGITAPEHNWDDYHNLDVSGKLVIILRHEPAAFHSGQSKEQTTYTTHAYFETKMKNAVRHGAAGIILFTDPAFEEYIDDMRFSERFSLPGDNISIIEIYPNHKLENYFAVHIAQDYAEDIIIDSFGLTLKQLENDLLSGKKPYQFEGTELKADLNIPGEIIQETVKARNVAGMLLKDSIIYSNEWVVIGAHHDHIGAFNGTGDTVFNGADDNASGTAAVLELAEAFATSPELPQYNIIFITFSAEEKGLLGSRYFVNYYTDLDFKYMVNLDMIGRNPDKNIMVFYSRNNVDNITDFIKEANPENEINLSMQQSGRDAYSDDRSFADEGVPSIFIFTGFHPDYHGTGDHADRLDYNRMELICGFAQNFVNNLEFTEE